MGFPTTIPAMSSTVNSDDNVTTSITQLPVNILEAFIPGYSIISRFLLEALGFDITIAVSVCFLIFGLFTSIQFLWNHAYACFKLYYTSFISIDSDDDIHAHVMNWIGEQTVSKNAQSLLARTGTFAWDEDTDDTLELLQDDVLLNFSDWGSKVPPKFQPYFGNHRFWHNGRPFELQLSVKQTVDSGWNGLNMREEKTLKLSCIGRSTQPIKDLIHVCQEHYFSGKSLKTIVRRPATKQMRSMGRRPWTMVASRPSRPMDTVVLEHDQKERVLADINEYLHPATPQWYANRGIPYRRGYLFHGPPGTGKTSLSFAIAGIFGLDIYCISLLEPTLGEEDLGLLFSNLPRRCVVLLEDIDSAGLIRVEEDSSSVEKPEGNDQDESKNKAADSDSNDSIGLQIVKALKSVKEKSPKKAESDKGISLSGLLNAIDGVASHEGRVLVMTTNHPEKLDDALIRPGRVDMKVEFTMASRSQIRQLFVRMYSPDTRFKKNTTVKTATVKPSVLTSKPSTSTLELEDSNTSLANRGLKIPALLSTPPPTPKEQQILLPNPVKTLQIADIEAIAVAFADRLPENILTPAEIQGFLLTRKKDPRRALDEVEAWRDELVEAKKEKAKGKEGKGGEGKESKNAEQAKETVTKEDEGKEDKEKREEANSDEKLGKKSSGTDLAAEEGKKTRQPSDGGSFTEVQL